MKYLAAVSGSISIGHAWISSTLAIGLNSIKMKATAMIAIYFLTLTFLDENTYLEWNE